MRRSFTAAAIFAAALSAAAAAANATVLTFDTTADCATAEVTITAGTAMNPCTLNNTAFGTSPNGTRTLQGSAANQRFFTAAFEGTAGGVSVDLGNFGGFPNQPQPDDRFFLRGFDAMGTLLEADERTINGSVATLTTLSLMGSGFASVTFGNAVVTRALFADNLTFAIDAAAPVPLPATALLLLGGVAGLGALRRNAGAA